MIDTFEWKDEYLIGIDEVDEQHKTLFNIANAYEQSTNALQSKNALMNVYRYTREHFTLEEALMKEVQFPGYDDHQLEHNDFISEFSTLVSGYLNSPQEREKIITFFADWIVNHICTKDRPLALFVDRIQTP